MKDLGDIVICKMNIQEYEEQLEAIANVIQEHQEMYMDVEALLNAEYQLMEELTNG